MKVKTVPSDTSPCARCGRDCSNIEQCKLWQAWFRSWWQRIMANGERLKHEIVEQ